jgi:hypothetical protein
MRFLTQLAKASGAGTPTRADLARLDRRQKKKGSNDEWTHPHDPDAPITKMKDGRTHLSHKAEHAVDLKSGAIVGVTVQPADDGNTATIQETLPEAVEQLEAVAAVTDAVAGPRPQRMEPPDESTPGKAPRRAGPRNMRPPEYAWHLLLSYVQSAS